MDQVKKNQKNSNNYEKTMTENQEPQLKNELNEMFGL